MGRSRWNPWRVLRGREHIVFELDPTARLTGGAFYARSGNRAAIVIDPALPQTQRRIALAHELVHDERGMLRLDGAPVPLEVMGGREERRVEAIVAERLVPDDDLAELVRRRGDVEPITAAVVAEEFDVTVEVATAAMLRLAHRLGLPAA